MTILRAVGVLATALVLSGCGAGRQTAAPESTTETTTTTTTTAPKPTTKDGTDYAACADGNCEVTVDEPVTITVAGHSFEVKSIEDDAAAYVLTFSGGGTASGSTSGPCSSLVEFDLTGHGSMSTSLCGPSQRKLAAPEPRAGFVRLQMAAVTDHTAVIQIVTG